MDKQYIKVDSDNNVFAIITTSDPNLVIDNDFIDITNIKNKPDLYNSKYKDGTLIQLTDKEKQDKVEKFRPPRDTTADKLIDIEARLAKLEKLNK